MFQDVKQELRDAELGLRCSGGGWREQDDVLTRFQIMLVIWTNVLAGKSA
jgi:hypothetical protein